MSRTPTSIPPIAVPLQPNHRILRAERIPPTEGTLGFWRVWIYTNNFLTGTYLSLHDNGMAELVTEREDGYEVRLLKEPDK